MGCELQLWMPVVTSARAGSFVGTGVAARRRSWPHVATESPLSTFWKMLWENLTPVKPSTRAVANPQRHHVPAQRRSAAPSYAKCLSADARRLKARSTASDHLVDGIAEVSAKAIQLIPQASSRGMGGIPTWHRTKNGIRFR